MIQRYTIDTIGFMSSDNDGVCLSSDVEALEKECEGKQFIIDSANKINMASLLKISALEQLNADMLEVLKFYATFEKSYGLIGLLKLIEKAEGMK
jgi:hypothetical protein